MNYYAKQTGLGQYRLARTQKERTCFICNELIEKGQLRYATRYLSLCTKCADCWQKEGGKLGHISRAK